MSGKHLLDTNIAIAFLSGDDRISVQVSESNEVYVPLTVVGELYFGAYNSKRIEVNLNRIKDFTSNITVVPANIETANYYGLIRKELRTKGKPIPENDIWIAAVARQYGFKLVTRDTHFNVIDGLSLTTW